MKQTAELSTYAGVNPLICADPAETRYSVRCALEFLSDAVVGIEHAGGFDDRTAEGLRQLLLTCAGALAFKSEKPKKG